MIPPEYKAADPSIVLLYMVSEFWIYTKITEANRRLNEPYMLLFTASI